MFCKLEPVFFINETNWSFASEVNSIFIKCKKNLNTDYLKLLISWFKSNIFLWHVLCNYHSNTIVNKRIYSDLTIPILNDDRVIIENCNLILNKEKEFVFKYNQAINNSIDISIDSYIRQFNNEIRKILVKNEYVYYNHYNINELSAKLIKKDLGLKGYFVY